METHRLCSSRFIKTLYIKNTSSQMTILMKQDGMSKSQSSSSGTDSALDKTHSAVLHHATNAIGSLKPILLQIEAVSQPDNCRCRHQKRLEKKKDTCIKTHTSWTRLPSRSFSSQAVPFLPPFVDAYRRIWRWKIFDVWCQTGARSTFQMRLPLPKHPRGSLEKSRR